MIKISQDLKEFGKVDLEFSTIDEFEAFLDGTVKVCDHYGCKDLVDFGIATLKKQIAPSVEKKFDVPKRKFSEYKLSWSASRILDKAEELHIDLYKVFDICQEIRTLLEQGVSHNNPKIFNLVMELAKSLKFHIEFDKNKAFRYRQKVLKYILSKIYVKIFKGAPYEDLEMLIRQVTDHLYVDLRAIKEYINN